MFAVATHRLLPGILGFFALDNMQLHPLVLCCLCWLLACISLIGEGQCDRFSSDMLDVLSQRMYLGTFLRIGGGNLDSQHISQRIDSHMYLTAFLAFVSGITRTRAACAGGWECAYIKNHATALSIFSHATPGGSTDR